MKPIKFTWKKHDTFSTIHKKLLRIKGKSVMDTQDDESAFTIFDVGNIVEMHLEGLGQGFARFVAGDENYLLKDSGYNFKGMKVRPMWGFAVEYGRELTNGVRNCMKYNFMIPRNGTFENDVKDNSLVVDIDHPFVFYK